LGTGIDSIKEEHSAILLVKVSILPVGESTWVMPREVSNEPLLAIPVAQMRKAWKDNQRTSRAAQIGELRVEIISATGLQNLDTLGKSDPYCFCGVGGFQGKHGETFKTDVRNNTLNPCWNQTHVFTSGTTGDALHFDVRDKDIGEIDDSLGCFSLAFEDFYPSGFYGKVRLSPPFRRDGSQEHGENEYGDDDSDEEVSMLRRQQSKLNNLKCGLQVQEAERTQSFDAPQHSVSQYIGKMSIRERDQIIDMVFVNVILLNALVIGISMDYDSVVFTVIDVVFTISFLVELYLKFQLHGVKGYFQAHWLHTFDFALIIADVLQLALSRLIDSTLTDNSVPASLFRVVRLVRLVRLARLVRVDGIDDLVAMIHGMVGGMSTLIWSMILLLLFVYITSLLFREFFGRESKLVECNGECNVDITAYFDNVPRAMLTVFRFFFGDFTTDEGVNLIEGILVSYGTFATMCVCILSFGISIGVFNVIAAIFVESTLAAAFGLQKQRKTERMNDPILWNNAVSILIVKLFEYHGTVLDSCLSEHLDSLALVPITEREFQKFIQDAAVTGALDTLEIDAADHMYLFDILDNDNTGSIYVSQLVDGLQRLRGDPRRSDIITIDLMVRAIQEQTTRVIEGMDTILEKVLAIDHRTATPQAPTLKSLKSKGSITSSQPQRRLPQSRDSADSAN
jgi:hypothetical protein